MKFADLHLHTLFSDGTYTPEELILAGKTSGLSAIAVVDHDCVDAVSPSIDIGKTHGIEVLPGIELTAEYSGREVHILGYLFDYKGKGFTEKLDFLKKNRVDRVYKITDRLKDIGIPLKPESVFGMAKEGTVGRLHIARALVRNGFVGSIYEAFQKYIGDNCPAYVCNFRFTPAEAIRLIREQKGIPVLAHPYSFNRDELIPELVNDGLMGLEVHYPEHTQSMVNFYLKLAKENNLLVTGGSDCHGEAKPEIKIGSVKIPYELVEKLKEARLKL